MDDKIFELIEKMYSDLKNEIKTVNNQVIRIENDLKSEIKTLSNQVIRIENDLKPKVETALEGYKIIYEKLDSLDKKVEIITI